MASILRLRRPPYLEPAPNSSVHCDGKGSVELAGLLRPPAQQRKPSNSSEKGEKERTRKGKGRAVSRGRREWGCVDCCCWAIGCTCTAWWLLLVLYSSLHSALPAPESPGARLRREGLRALHPVVMVPGIVTGGLELWEGKPCAEGLFRKRIWGGSFAEIFRRPLCWLELMSLDNETGLDPPGIRLRPVPGLVAADYFTPGYFVWAVLIENLARIGYEEKNMYMTAYDWRLSFHNTEVRDQSLSRLKSKIELMVRTNGNRKVVVVPHSMGVLYFLYFMKWVETPPPLGGGGGPVWCAEHIKAIMNIGPAFLGVPKTVSGMLSAEAKDIAFARLMAPGVFDSKILSFQTLPYILRVLRTWDSIHSLLPKGGEAIWGDLDWSPEEGYTCDLAKKYLISASSDTTSSKNVTAKDPDFRENKPTHYGRIIAFGKMASQLPSSELSITNSKELEKTATSFDLKTSCQDVWTEYNCMSRDSISKIAKKKVYTAATIHDLLNFVAPKLTHRANAHFSYGVAENLDDPKYSHYKYWSNPLETKLPDAPAMEIYCLYGVGIPTERSYVYKLASSDTCNSIPFQIDYSADGGKGNCLRGGVHFSDGDGSVPVLSAGFMCDRGWRGKTRFNPSGMATFVREYQHRPPANLLEGRGAESGAHVDIMGNAALIEDVMRVVAGAGGDEIGGDKIYSNIRRISQRINIRL